MRTLAILACVVFAAVICGLFLVACESPAAQREQARAERIQAEAIAYQIRQEADARAASERASIRQMERDAAHQRVVEMMPFVMLISGGIIALIIILLMAWDLRRIREMANPELLFYERMARLQLSQREDEQIPWAVIYRADDARQLSSGNWKEDPRTWGM